MVLHKHVAYQENFLEVVTLKNNVPLDHCFGSAMAYLLSLIKQDPAYFEEKRIKELQNGHLDAYDSFQNSNQQQSGDFEKGTFLLKSHDQNEYGVCFNQLSISDLKQKYEQIIESFYIILFLQYIEGNEWFNHVYGMIFSPECGVICIDQTGDFIQTSQIRQFPPKIDGTKSVDCFQVCPKV